MTEHRDQDHCLQSPNCDCISGLSGAIPTEGTNWDVFNRAWRTGCCTTILEAYKRSWWIVNEYECNYRRALCESDRLQDMMSDFDAGLPSYGWGSGERQHTGIDKVWMTISWKSYEIDTGWYMRTIADGCDIEKRRYNPRWIVKSAFPVQIQLESLLKEHLKQHQCSLRGWACRVVN